MSQNAAAVVPQLTLTGDPVLYDRRGYPRSACTLPSFRKGVSPPNKGRTMTPDVPTPEETYRLVDAIGNSTRPSLEKHALRNQSVVVTMWRAGLRISEALALEVKDIDWEQRRLVVLKGKGSKRRVCAMDPEGFAYLERWREKRAELGFGPGPLHCVINGPSKGLAMGDAQVRIFMKKAGKEAQIDREIRRHAMRHGWATFHARNRSPLSFVQQQLGHSNLGVTSRYMVSLSPEEMLQFMAAVEWPTHPEPSVI